MNWLWLMFWLMMTVIHSAYTITYAMVYVASGSLVDLPRMLMFSLFSAYSIQRSLWLGIKEYKIMYHKGYFS